jgi:hypothetical protein
MEYFAGLDVSMAETHVCDASGSLRPSSRGSIGCLPTVADAFAGSGALCSTGRHDRPSRSETTLACILRTIRRAGYPSRLPSVATEVGPAGSIEGAP